MFYQIVYGSFILYLFCLFVILIIRNLFLFLRIQRIKDFSDVRLLLHLSLLCHLFDHLFSRSDFIFKVFFYIEAKVAVRHYQDTNVVLSLLLLTITYFECLCQLVEVEVFIKDNKRCLGVTNHYMPSFILEEGVTVSTTEIT